MEDLSKYCATGAAWRENRVKIQTGVSLRIFEFVPPVPTKNPTVFFIAGWISLIQGWQEVLQEMTRDFRVIYVETREKRSAEVEGKVSYGVEAIAEDLTALIDHYRFEEQGYVYFGSSLGATAILESCSALKKAPLCLVLVAPNAVFRMPRFGKIIARIFYPGIYVAVRPFIKWYLRTFRLDVKSDAAQYAKYCNALDSADPWKLKKAALAISRYEVWGLLPGIPYPALIVGASKDQLHEPENLKRMAAMMPNARYLDMGTNRMTHSKDLVSEMREYLRTVIGNRLIKKNT